MLENAETIAPGATPVAPLPKPPRARGAVTVSGVSSPRGTEIGALRQAGSLKAMFPRRTGAELPVVLVNTAGGLTGGDRFDVDLKVGPNAQTSVTTQAAERAYRATKGQRASMISKVYVASGGRLNWLPQETILFDGCAYDRRLRVDLEDDAELLLVEPIVFGRTAMGEVLHDASFSDIIDIRRAGKPLYLDQMRLNGDIAAQMARRGTGNGAGAMACLVYASPDAEAQLDTIRAMLPPTAGASLIQGDLLAMRLLAPDSHLLRQSLIPVLNHLTNNALPRPWMI